MNASKITCIKIIRQYTGLDLVEAKNAYESPVNYGLPFSIKVNPKERRHIIDDLRKNGMNVS
jgi:ribosomal protein L7/L12